MGQVVVIGGAGFIGSHIVEEALKRNHHVSIFDNLETGSLQNVANLMRDHRVKMHCGSIMEPQSLDQAIQGAETIFHLGALISVPESMEQMARYVEVNTLGTLNVLEAALRCGVKNVVLSSSAAIYGNNPSVPKLESMVPEPMSPYAITKLDGEYYLDIYRREHGLNAVSLRYFNVFGPRQDPKSQYAAAIPIFVSKALNNEPIVIYGDGQQTRDFVYVKDVVQANFLVAEKGGDLFNVAYGQKITILELAQQIIKMTESDSEIRHESPRAGDVKHSMADPSKIMKIGFEPVTDFSSALEQTVAFFKQEMAH